MLFSVFGLNSLIKAWIGRTETVDLWMEYNADKEQWTIDSVYCFLLHFISIKCERVYMTIATGIDQNCKILLK